MSTTTATANGQADSKLYQNFFRAALSDGRSPDEATEVAREHVAAYQAEQKAKAGKAQTTPPQARKVAPPPALPRRKPAPRKAPQAEVPERDAKPRRKRREKAEPGPLPDRDDYGIPTIKTAEGRTELANAKRFVALAGDDVRYCDTWGRWLSWDSRRWAIDDTRAVERRAKSVFELVWQQAAELRTDEDAVRFAIGTGSARGQAAMLALARSEDPLPIRPPELNRDPWLLNCGNGTLDLRTGKLRPPSRGDMLTVLCPTAYRPGATCPTWLAFLERIMGGSQELVDFLRRAAGYSLTGSVQEHAFFFLYGTGANGKSTFLGAMEHGLGTDYSMHAPHNLLLAKQGETHPTDIADLAGKRFVSCVESEEGRRLAESLVKELTGGDRVRARRMREDFWQFDPTHKIWLAANHKPPIRGTDLGIWRRIRLVPFTVEIPKAEQDRQLHAPRPDWSASRLPARRSRHPPPLRTGFPWGIRRSGAHSDTRRGAGRRRPDRPDSRRPSPRRRHRRR